MLASGEREREREIRAHTRLRLTPRAYVAESLIMKIVMLTGLANALKRESERDIECGYFNSVSRFSRNGIQRRRFFRLARNEKLYSNEEKCSDYKKKKIFARNDSFSLILSRKIMKDERER